MTDKAIIDNTKIQKVRLWPRLSEGVKESSPSVLFKSTEDSLHVSDVSEILLENVEENLPDPPNATVINSLAIFTNLENTTFLCSNAYFEGLKELKELLDQLNLFRNYPTLFPQLFTPSKSSDVQIQNYQILNTRSAQKLSKNYTDFNEISSAIARSRAETPIFITSEVKMPTPLQYSKSLLSNIINREKCLTPENILRSKATSKRRQLSPMNLKHTPQKLRLLSLSQRRYCLNAQMSKSLALVFCIPLAEVTQMRRKLGCFNKVKLSILEQLEKGS